MRRNEKTVKSGGDTGEVIQPDSANHQRIAFPFSQRLHLFGERVCGITEQTTYQKLFHEIWIKWFETTLRRHLDESQISSDALSATLAEWFISPQFHGCAFINASAEAKSEDIESEIKEICRNHKFETKKVITLLTGMADENVVSEIMLLIDGAIIHAQMGINSDEVINQLKAGLMRLSGNGYTPEQHSYRK